MRRLENTVISLWKDGNKVKDCGTIPYVYLKSNSERNQTYVEYCGRATGDMVKVSRTGQYLHFAEIRIYSKICESMKRIKSSPPFYDRYLRFNEQNCKCNYTLIKSCNANSTFVDKLRSTSEAFYEIFTVHIHIVIYDITI